MTCCLHTPIRVLRESASWSGSPLGMSGPNHSHAISDSRCFANHSESLASFTDEHLPWHTSWDTPWYLLGARAGPPWNYPNPSAQKVSGTTHDHRNPWPDSDIEDR